MLELIDKIKRINGNRGVCVVSECFRYDYFSIVPLSNVVDLNLLYSKKFAALQEAHCVDFGLMGSDVVFELKVMTINCVREDFKIKNSFSNRLKRKVKQILFMRLF